MNKKKIEAIKQRIRKQFGTIRNFANVSGIPEKIVRQFFAGKMNPKLFESTMLVIQKKMDQFKGVKIVNPYLITDVQREQVRQNIMVRHKSVRQFCMKNPKFSNVFVSNVISGRRKKIDTRVVELIRASGISKK